jgi:regulatory protein
MAPRSGSRRGRRPAGPRGPDGPTPGSVGDQAQDADPYAVARAIALRQLTMGPRTRAQLSDAMARRGVPEEVAEAILVRFEEVSLIDDEEFARQWVQSRHTGRGLARRALAHELSRRGVDGDVVRGAVDEISTDDELTAARELVRRRLPSTASDDPARRTRRLAAMLARKGYGSETAFRAIREELADAVTMPDDDEAAFDPVPDDG